LTSNKQISFGQKLGLSRSHAALLARLNTPEKIQDFVTALPINTEPNGDTCLSVHETLSQQRAHCIEGAFVAAAALWLNGEPPLLMDMKAEGDDDHVITLFRHRGCWGGISKSNHVWLRWRDPIYKSLRELALSYFHEYATDAGHKTLRSYSRSFDLRGQDPALWVSNKDSCWEMAAAVDSVRHYPLITRTQAKHLRPRDKMEIKASKILEYR
jgi:hypothetical protein